MNDPSDPRPRGQFDVDSNENSEQGEIRAAFAGLRMSNVQDITDLLRRALELKNGYVTVSRLKPQRREETIARFESRDLYELRHQVDVAMRQALEIPNTTGCRVRSWRRGGKSYDSLQCRLLDLGEKERVAATWPTEQAASEVVDGASGGANSAGHGEAVAEESHSCKGCDEWEMVWNEQSDDVAELKEEIRLLRERAGKQRAAYQGVVEKNRELARMLRESKQDLKQLREDTEADQEASKEALRKANASWKNKYARLKRGYETLQAEYELLDQQSVEVLTTVLYDKRLQKKLREERFGLSGSR